MAGPGKKGKCPMRPTRGAEIPNAAEAREKIGEQQVGGPKGSLASNANNGAEFSLSRKSVQIRLFDETEDPTTSNGRKTATGSSRHELTTPTSIEQQNTTPTSVQVGSNQSIGCGSDRNNESDDVQQNDTGGINVTRKRGYTRNIALSKEKKAGKKVKVQVSEVSGRVIGEGAQQYISEASCVIRKYGKWKAEKWSKLQESDREGMLKLVNNSFAYDEGEHVKPALLKQLNTQYRSRRYNFHKIFKKFSTKEEALANRPQYVEESDWIYLCDYFCSLNFMKISERNKINRSKQKTAHTAGTKSFLRHKAYREAQEGREVGPIELYDITHYSKKKNAMVDETSAMNLSVMKEKKLESESSGANRTEEDISIEVTGRVTGYVHGRGPSKAGIIAQKLAEIDDFKKRAEQAEKRSAELEITVQSQQQLMEKLVNQQSEMQNQQSEMQDLLKSLKAQLQANK
ncbi:uncharacterized protein [Coffea arabica]|uniref:Uncharacterized protein n=1 Tax=Coffea arabica TaxID=13443 RepID=A0ABM4U6E6_COFAR